MLYVYATVYTCYTANSNENKISKENYSIDFYNLLKATQVCVLK